MKVNGRMTRVMAKGKCSIHWGLLFNQVHGRMMSFKFEEYLFALCIRTEIEINL